MANNITSMKEARDYSLSLMQSVHGTKGKNRLEEIINGIDNASFSSTAQSVEYTLQMAKMALIAQQRLSEKYSRHGSKTVADRRIKTDTAVADIDSAIEKITTSAPGGKNGYV